MFLLDYIINLSIFSLLVSTPLVVRSFLNHKPFPRVKLLAGLYGGLVSVILVLLSFQQQGYSFDIRFAPVLLLFAYLGPVPGVIAGAFSLTARLFTSGHWTAAITGWLLVMAGLSLLLPLLKRLSPLKKSAVLFGAYSFIYSTNVLFFNILNDHPWFHLQYLLFVGIGVVIGGLLIESYVKLYRLNSRLSETYKQMEASEAKYRLIAENTSDLIMLMNRDSSVAYASPSHEQVLGYQDKEVNEKDLCQFIHPDDNPAAKQTFHDILEQKESQSMELRIRHSNGSWIEFESRFMPVLCEDGCVGHIVIISRDISERKKAEEILLQSEKLSIVGELAAGVAHEIRNPLTTIKGFVQLYKWEKGSDEYNELLLSELGRIETITSELLSLGKPQAVKLSRANVMELIEYATELLSPQANMYDIEFIFSPTVEQDLFITCEVNQIKQVILNLLKNAIESMADGGEIHLSLETAEEGMCMISIRDHGCGIPENLLPRLGEPFYSLKEKGTGLGLMICHKIIKQHHGSITYQSKLNEGTLIKVRLPLAKD
ncbi:ATP-binding protein [Mesobacillus foraminis]|uniref:ATP-binding protein n=1 Tax=Mesobacillus foraminis TaxID=279826 RepID=UPI0039A0A082